MNRVMDNIMISCNSATILVEKRLDAGLTLSERLKLRLHTSMCSGCTNYQKQSLLIHRVWQRDIMPPVTDNTLVLSDLKTTILKRLEMFNE